MSRLDDTGGASFRSHSSAHSKPPRPGSVTGLDASELDGNASVALFDAASERPSKPRSQAPSQRAPSIAGSVAASARSGGGADSRATSASSLGSSFLRKEDDEDKASHAGTDAPSERSSKPRSSAPQQRTSGNGAGSRYASDASFGLSGAVDDDGDASVAASARSAATPHSARAPSATTSRSAGSRLASEANFGLGGGAGGGDDDGSDSVSGSQQTARMQRSPSLTSGHGTGLASESSMSRSLAADAAADDDGGSSVAASDRYSKPRSSPAPSQRGGGSVADRSRQATESNMGFSGFSIAGKDAEDDDESSVAATSERPPPYHRSASSTLSSRKPSEVNPPGGGTTSTLTAGDESAALSETGTELRSMAKSGSPAASRKASDTGGISMRSSRPSGTSGGSASFSKDEEEAASATPSSRRRSFASSLRQSVASNKAASESGESGEEYTADADGEGGASASGSASFRQSHGADDAASTRSGVSAASRSEKSHSAAPSVSGVSTRSGRSAAPSSHTVTSARTASAAAKTTTEDNEYGDEGFEEEVVEGTGSGGDEESVAAASSASKRTTSVAGSARPLSASSRQSSARSARSGTGAATTTNGGYSNEFDEAASASAGHRSRSVVASEPAMDDKAEESAAEGDTTVAEGSIFMQPHESAPGSSIRRSGASVFRRLPADAPDEPPGASAAGSVDGGSRRPPRSGSASVRSGDGGAGSGGEWNEGAVRVAAPGAPRPATAPGAGAGAQRPRPMSAAPRDRQAALLDGLIRKHPATWDSVDVATWVEFLGLGQYRRRFLHHCIDGRLLLRMTDAQLKSELGIGPMGHRSAILDAAANLTKNYKEAQRDRLAAGGGDEGDDVEGGGDGERREFGRSSTAPRSRQRPASAMPGALTMPPPPPNMRRPASASRSVIPPDPFLGPAMGKVTVYEQRAKLLFELDRAQARAEQHRALAEQLKYTATLSADEVSHIRGLLVEIEKKNRAAFELSGGVDSAARVPWRHVGNGTKHNNWNPERFARPGDPETVDLTFQPRCTNPESRKLLGGLGGGDYGENSSAVNSFLDRLNNDLRKREQSRKELERRYYADSSANPQAAIDADMQLVREALQARCHINMATDPADYEPQIDEAVDKLATSDSWREANLLPGPIKAAKGTAKVVAFATALRALSFMERYRSDLRSKGSRARALEKKWLNQTLGAQYLPGGKDKDDLEEAAKFFALLGWRDGDGNPSEEAVDPDLLDKLLDRALEYRKQFDAWWERARDKPEDRTVGFKCSVNWHSHPWDSDGLAPLMKDEILRMGGDGSGANPDGSQPPVMDFVEFTVHLLGKCREDDLLRMRSLNSRPKRLAVYRAIRTQKFIEFTQKDLEERDRKLREAYKALAPPRRRIEPSRIEGFFERLVEDAAKRRARAEKIAHEKVQKEQEILASSIMYGRLRTAAR